MVTIKKISFLISTLCLSFLLVTLVHAQSDPIIIDLDVNATITLSMSPQNPTPGDTVHLKVTGGSLVDLQDSTITWFQNGKNISKGVGNTDLDIKAGALGQEINIVVQVTPPGGISSTQTLSIIPTHIDLLIDSDSYTPPFYRGRALPSAGTRLRMQALTYFKRPNGSLIPPSSIIYTWSQNGQIAGSLSGLGHQTVTLPSPVLYSTDVIKVDAASTDGTLHGSASITLSSVQPLITLYEDHPLFGLMYHQMMGDQTSIPDSEMTFAAVLYFAQIKGPTDPRLQYTWKVNGAVVPSNAVRPDEITINADKSKGDANIGLSISHTTNFFMSPRGTWDVTFKTIGQVDNPFSKSF